MEHAKAYDTGQPRNGTILFYAILTVILLGMLRFALDSYFAKMMDAEYHEKVALRGLEQVENMRAKEAATLQKNGGLDRAMQALAQRGRTGAPAITPESGAGKPAVTGWTQLRPAAPAAPAAAPAPVADPATAPAVAPSAAPSPTAAPVPGAN